MPGCKRVARKGKPFCSRCTMIGKTEELRDALPGMTRSEAKIATFKEVYGTEAKERNVVVVEDPNVTSTVFVQSKQDYYTRRQVCIKVGVSPTTLQRWERKGYVPMPMKVAHSGQLLYTDELIQKITEYKNLAFTPQVQNTANQAPSPGRFRPTGKGKFTIGKKVEKTVARNLNFGRGGLL